MANKYYAFDPDYVIPPGETLLEVLESVGMTQSELATRMRRPKKTVNEIVKGKAMITPDTAIELEKVLGVPATFWISLENNYRIRMARKREGEKLSKQVGWLKKFPIKQMIEYGWIQSFSDKTEQLRELLRFLGVVNIDALRDNQVVLEAMYRKSDRFQCDRESLIVWLRKGEIEARNIHCGPFNESAFREAIKAIRTFTLKSPEEFLPVLKKACTDVGVIFLLVRELPRCPVSGAARWLAPSRPLIQLNIRYKTNDHFWFSFFHEAGHILKHGKKHIFIDNGNLEGKVEEEANRFAQDCLIPPAEYVRFVSSFGNRRVTKQMVLDFATRIGVHPGIIVGRLQHDKVIGYECLNGLKDRFNWAD